MSKILMRNAQYYNYLAPWDSDYDIITIAQALSNLCRFNGHTREFYSVAQHCVEMSRLVPSNFALAALMHDAHEAFVGDIPTPMKRLLGESFADLERVAQLNVSERFNVSYNRMNGPVIKNADMIMLATERRDLLPLHFDDGEWPELPQPMMRTLLPWSHEKACHEFIIQYRELVQ